MTAILTTGLNAADGDRVMLLLATTISRLIDRWHTADATEYGVLSLSIVVLGWFISKYYVD